MASEREKLRIVSMVVRDDALIALDENGCLWEETPDNDGEWTEITPFKPGALDEKK